MPWVHLEPNQFACVNDAGDVTTAVIESADFQSNSADSSSLGVAQLRLARPVIVIPAGSPPPVVEQLATAERAARHEATRLRLELNNATAHRDNWRARCEQAEARLQPLIDALARREAMATPALVVSDLPPEIRAQILRQRPAPPLQEVSTQPLYNHRNEIIAQIPQRPEPAPPAAPDYVAYALPAGTVLPTSIVQGDPVTISLPPPDAPLPDRGVVQSTANTAQPDLFSHANGGLLGSGRDIQAVVDANLRQVATRLREEADQAFMAAVLGAAADPNAPTTPPEPASLSREDLRAATARLAAIQAPLSAALSRRLFEDDLSEEQREHLLRPVVGDLLAGWLELPRAPEEPPAPTVVNRTDQSVTMVNSWGSAADTTRHVSREQRRDWLFTHTDSDDWSSDFFLQQHNRIHAVLDVTPEASVPADANVVVSYGRFADFPTPALPAGALYFCRGSGTLWRAEANGSYVRYVRIAPAPALVPPAGVAAAAAINQRLNQAAQTMAATSGFIKP